jgi:hypothetical protein
VEQPDVVVSGEDPVEGRQSGVLPDTLVYLGRQVDVGRRLLLLTGVGLVGGVLRGLRGLRVLRIERKLEKVSSCLKVSIIY